LRSTVRRSRKSLASRIGVDGLYREFGDDLPLRSELFSVDQLEHHAEALAQWHQIEYRPGTDRLLDRLADNERILLDAYRVLTDAAAHNRPISPAGEWLLDNFYVIEEQIRTARRHLPKQYSQGLPQVSNGPSSGYPRVYDLALELISHVDGRIDADSLRSFVTAYQRKSYLDLGELWAIPIMMRQALIENLRRVAARIARGTLDRNKASHWADQFIECAEQTPSRMVLIVADMARQDPLLSSAFVAELVRRLSGQSPALAVPLTWIEQRLWEDGRTIEHMVQSEGHQQAVDQVSIGNSIISLRELDAIDWRMFVESLSIVEQTLLSDPAGIYSKMDFGTRDHYRHIIERIAKRSPLTEQAVASQAVQLASRNLQEREANPHWQSEEAREMGLSQEGKSRFRSNPEGDHRSGHVGYFLIDRGLLELEHTARMRPSLSTHIGRIGRRVPLTIYLGSILIISLAVTAGTLSVVGASGWLSWVMAGLLFLGATQLGVGLVNWLVTLSVKPHRLPRLDFSDGIPLEFSTLVAVPTMLINEPSIDQLLEGLEVRYLANRDGNLYFCLLTDYRDASEEHLPEDDCLLKLAQLGIESLNAKYCQGRGDIFFLFHRPRRWNPGEKVWMGHERKRGKLSDLNRLLLGGFRDAYSLIVGDTSSLSGVKYVITLDTDTLLPRNTARQLAATLAHPLNHPRLDVERNVVTEGYGILQPGVATTLEPGGQSWFARVHCSEAGVDPYTRTISDVYQDLFQEGSFIGKGIYDLQLFSATTEHRFLENQILSHDLLEGCYARCGLVNDIQVYESFPAQYSSDVSRRHRWMRGDWQISGWILPFISGPSGRFQRNPLSALSRWKILDNLRRSIIPCLLMLLLLLGWLASPPAWLWTAIVMGIVLIPVIFVSVLSASRKATDVPFRAHWRDVAASMGNSLLQAGMSIAFLPYEASVSLDAILRTLVRMRWTRARMLEWKTASDAERESHRSLVGMYQKMWIAPALAILTAAILLIARPEAIPAAALPLVLWLLAPLIAWRISWPASSREVKLSDQQKLFLHLVSRRTWRFFDRFLGPEDNWLPPDNYQEEPLAAIAHRTSPTNIGISLLSTLAAHDFGIISAGRLVEWSRNTLSTLERLERFQGHFLNWYDTRTLQPLLPWYVSSVDSGNLIGHLLTLRAGLQELPHQPLVSSRLWESLSMMREILESTATASGEVALMTISDSAAFEELLNTLPQGDQMSRTASPAAANDLLRELLKALEKISIAPLVDDEPEGVTWLRELQQQCSDHRSDLLFMAPWLDHSATIDGLRQSLAEKGTASLGSKVRKSLRIDADLQIIVADP
jgi:cyclic beta-1,2-glucan synthetase